MCRRLSCLWKYTKKHASDRESDTQLQILVYFDISFNFLYKPATMNLAKTETLQLGSTTG